MFSNARHGINTSETSLIANFTNIFGNDGNGINIVNSLGRSIIVANSIKSSGGAGIAVTDNDGNNLNYALLLDNISWSNAGLPIDLGDDGHTSNDPGDVDNGPNGLLNYPVVTSITGSQVQGTVCGGCQVQVYAAIGNPAANGGGTQGFKVGDIIADSSGNWAFDFAPISGTPDTATYTATNENPTSDFPFGTSEMSPVGNTLSVSVTGEGTVISTPAGIDCGSTCAADFSVDSTVNLIAEPDPAWTVGGWDWTGDCSGSGACNVVMDSDKSVGVSFHCVLISIDEPEPISASVPAWECFDLEAVSGFEVVGPGGEVTFRAENSITLGSGFKVGEGGIFYAEIMP